MSNDLKINTYKISRELFDWGFDNPDKIKPAHIAIYFYSLDMNNRFGWKSKFGFPTLQAMEATGIKSKNTYYKAFHELIHWGLIEVVEKSKNQNTANIITIPAVLKFKSAQGTARESALDSANIQQEDSGGNIDKQVNQKTTNKKHERAFRAPSVDEVYKYMIEKGLNERKAEKESKKFWDHYEMKDWYVGKNKIKKWKSAVSGWINRMPDFDNTSNKSQNKNVTNGSNSRIQPDDKVRREGLDHQGYMYPEEIEQN